MTAAYTPELLSARAEISEVFNDYATALDTRDWELFRRCFTEDAESDLSSLNPGSTFSSADDLVEYAKRTIAALSVTQHIITNHSHHFGPDGTTCRSRSYLHGQHIATDANGNDAQFIACGHYDYDMVKTEAGWKIRRYRLTVTWTSGGGEELARALKDAKS